MEAALGRVNGLFHFDLQLARRSSASGFSRNIDSFNAYLDKVLSQKSSDFVFVAWSDPERSELLSFPKEEKAFTASLLHQGCIQFIKGFIDNPPIWLREGVATYLDGPGTRRPARLRPGAEPRLAGRPERDDPRRTPNALDLRSRTSSRQAARRRRPRWMSLLPSRGGSCSFC